MPETASPSVDLLPARMLNEFVYCPRLYYYEHVERIFIHNADTKRGAAQHSRVDAGSGAMPAATPVEGNESEQPEQAQGADDACDEDSPHQQQPSSLPETSEPETIHCRSVTLGSDTLGVVAKLDLVEVTLEAPLHPDQQTLAARICPVEYKSGSPRCKADGSLELWDADRVQLGVQILLLRENGYICEEGIIYYKQTRQRVRFQMEAESEEWIKRCILAARNCGRGPIPPPLDHSPKCPRCSLSSICLPDETQLLSAPQRAQTCSPETSGIKPWLVEENAAVEVAKWADMLESGEPSLDAKLEPRIPKAGSEGEVRRLIAADVDTKAMYVNTPGVSVTKKAETVVIKEQGEKLAEVRIKDLHHLAIFGSAQVSTALLQTLCEREIPTSYFSMGGWFYGLTRGHGLSNVFTRVRQFAVAGEREQALQLARLFVYGKIRNQRTLLMRNHTEPPVSALRILKNGAVAALTADNHASLLGIEGAAALCYFKHFSGMIKDPAEEDQIPGLEDPPTEPGSSDGASGKQLFSFDLRSRNRRPPRDPVNALLSFAYSLLSRDCTIAAYAVGFDPYVGFFHQPRFGRPALALDLMEEFRPLVADSVVLTAINNRMLGPGDFVRAGDAVNLNTGGRKRFIQVYEKRMGDIVTHPVFDYKVSYRRALELQYRLLARTLTGEIEQYVPFTTR